MAPKNPQLSLNFQEIDELALKILSRHPFGLLPAKIRQDLPPSYRCSIQELTARLENLAAQGRLHVWRAAGNAPKLSGPIYSIGRLDRAIHTRVLDLLSFRDATPAEIKRNFPPHVGRFLPRFLSALIEQGEVKWHPPKKGKRLSRREPDPGEFLAKEIKKLFEKGDKLGFSQMAVFEAIRRHAQVEGKPTVSSPGVEGIICQRMKELEPASTRGALVYIPKLRKALNDRLPDKRAFDEAILSLADQGKVQLQSHSRPGELTEEEKDAMIDNGRGSYFMAIGIRME